MAVAVPLSSVTAYGTVVVTDAPQTVLDMFVGRTMLTLQEFASADGEKARLHRSAAPAMPNRRIDFRYECFVFIMFSFPSEILAASG